MADKYKCMICGKIFDYTKDPRPLVEVKNRDGSLGIYDGCCSPGSLIEIKEDIVEPEYYTPTIEEFHVGFEFEIVEYGGSLVVGQPINKKWKTTTIDDSYDFNTVWDIYNERKYKQELRVKYLDREDIESLGFEKSFDEPDEWFHNYKGNFNIQLYFDDKIREKDDGVGISIYVHNCTPNFNGYIKNKSELKKLLTQLNIT